MSSSATNDGVALRRRQPRTAPRATPETRFFWDGVEAGELRLQQCGECLRIRHPVAAICRWCRSDRVLFVRSAGIGELYSFAVPHRPVEYVYEPGMIIALVELREQVRVVANLHVPIGVTPQIGMQLELFFRRTDGVDLPAFRPLGLIDNWTKVSV